MSDTAPVDGWAAFRHPGVLRFAVGRFLSAIATTSVSTAVMWQLYETTGSKLALGLVGLVEVVPVVALALVAGSVADRFPRRTVAMLSHLTLAIAAGALMWLSSHHGPLPLFYVALFITGVGMTFRGASVGSMLPQLVPARDFVNANAWFSSTYELASISGPAVAGFLIALAGDASWALGLATVAHVGFVGVLWSLPKHPAAMTGKRQGWNDLIRGWRFVRSTPVFLGAITLDLFAVLLGGAVALLPVFAKDVLHVGPVGLGWLRAAPSLGALSMALLQTRLPPWKKPGVALLVAVTGFGIATVVFGLSTWMPLSLLALFFTGVFDNVSVVVRSTLEQALTPESMRGRVSAIHYVFIGMSNELGAFESGAAAAAVGPIAAVVGGGVGTMLVVLAVALVFPSVRRLPPLHQLKPLPEPADVEF